MTVQYGGMSDGEEEHWRLWEHLEKTRETGKIIRTTHTKQIVPMKYNGEIVGTAEVDLETGEIVGTFNGTLPSELKGFSLAFFSISGKAEAFLKIM